MASIRILVVVLFAAITLTAGAQEREPGTIVMVGGGGTPDAVMAKLVELAQGGLVVVVPQASARANAGQGLVDFFRSHGAKNIEVLNVTNLELGQQQLESAKLVWFGGGSQSRLMERLPFSYVETIKKQHLEGCHVGGTSAGAAAMAAKMISGTADLQSIRAGQTELVEGLSLTDMIVDQHFHRRQRFNRLLAAVLDNPNSIGVGIDEKTAALLVGDQIHVMGNSSVLVVNASDAELESLEAGDNQSAIGVKISLLTDGQMIELSPKK